MLGYCPCHFDECGAVRVYLAGVYGGRVFERGAGNRIADGDCSGDCTGGGKTAES